MREVGLGGGGSWIVVVMKILEDFIGSFESGLVFEKGLELRLESCVFVFLYW